MGTRILHQWRNLTVKMNTTRGNYLRGMKILIVDDFEDNRDLIQAILEEGELGMYFEAGSGSEAIKVLKSHPDMELVLLDINMPGITGHEVLQYIQGHPTYKSIPVIMITAQTDQETAIRCIEAGASDYITKPVEDALLRARVRNSLERKMLFNREKELLKQVQKEKHKSEDLLFNVLPRSVANRLREGETQIADNLDNVTVLFSDLCGFTNLTNQQSADELIYLLNALFGEFDRLSRIHKVEKIKTMGDGYMAVSGITTEQTNHANRAAKFGRDTIFVTQKIGQTLGFDLSLRVGLCSGPVVAGIIGSHRSIFDLWGDTVNLAARMEQFGHAGKIQMTESTYAQLSNPLNCHQIDNLEIPGVGAMRPWIMSFPEMEHIKEA